MALEISRISANRQQFGTSEYVAEYLEVCLHEGPNESFLGKWQGYNSRWNSIRIWQKPLSDFDMFYNKQILLTRSNNNLSYSW